VFRGTVTAALLYLSTLGVAQAETIQIRCGKDLFKVDTTRSTLETAGRLNRISWIFDGEWIRLTFANGKDRLAFSSKNGYVLQNGKQINASCRFLNPEALARIKVAPTANLRVEFIALAEPNRKLIQGQMSLNGYYNSTIDGLWGTGTEEALVNYKGYVEGITGQRYQLETPFGASQYLQAVIQLSYEDGEGDECDGCEETMTVGPSFDCNKSTTLDERAICANPTLAELDVILNVAFRQVVQNRGQQAAKIVSRLHLDQRRQCGADTKCIEKVQRDAISRLIALGAQVTVTPNARAETAPNKVPDTAKPEPVVYIKRDEADYILASIEQFAIESPGELTIDFVINLDSLRQAAKGAWSDRKAQQFEAALKEISATPAIANRISSARADFAREQTEGRTRASAALNEKLGKLKVWVLNNAISENAPEIAQFLKRGEEVLLQGNYEEILPTTERADLFLKMVEPKEQDQTAAVETSATAAAQAEESGEKPEIRVKVATYEAQSTLGDAFEQYSAQKGQILLPVRLVFQPGKDATSINPSDLKIELGTETGARYPVNELATLSLAAQQGVSPSTEMTVWAPGDEVFLVFEIPRLNAIPKMVHINSDVFEFKLIQE
jgi:hypothetical protein